MMSDYPPIPEVPSSSGLQVTKKKIKLRKINQQEKEEIFKDYYERKRELSPLKGTLTSKNFFTNKKTSTSHFGRSDDTRAS